MARLNRRQRRAWKSWTNRTRKARPSILIATNSWWTDPTHCYVSTVYSAWKQPLPPSLTGWMELLRIGALKPRDLF